jgi:hypothetical protein
MSSFDNKKIAPSISNKFMTPLTPAESSQLSKGLRLEMHSWVRSLDTMFSMTQDSLPTRVTQNFAYLCAYAGQVAGFDVDRSLSATRN